MRRKLLTLPRNGHTSHLSLVVVRLRMGERACYLEFCPACDAPVTMADERCPDCGEPLADSASHTPD